MIDFIVLDSLQAVPESLPFRSSEREAVLLTFSSNEEITKRIYRVLERKYTRVEVISAAGHLDQAATSVREEYSRIVSKAPDKIKFRGKHLRDAFTFENRLSLWWLNEIFSKRSDAYPTFLRLCQLEVIRKFAKVRKVNHISLISWDPDFQALICSFCNYSGVGFQSLKPRRGQAWMSQLSILRIIISTFLWLFEALVQKIIVHLLIERRGDATENKKPYCAFHVIYPLMGQGKKYPGGDEKYGRSLSILSATNVVCPAYVYSVAADGFHQRVRIPTFLRLCLQLRLYRDAIDIPVFLLEGYLTLKDLMLVCSIINLIWKYYQLERSSEFHNYWYYKGVDFFPMIRRELRLTMVRTPRYLLYALKVRRFVNETHSVAFVYTLFEHGIGRAMAYGARTATNDIALISVQEGPWSKLKLAVNNYPGELEFERAGPQDFINHPPLPDRILLEGNNAHSILVESGYPVDCLEIVGAPRIEHLLKVPLFSDRVKTTIHSNRYTVLVVLGQHDAHQTIATCRPVIRERQDFHFIFKLHPRGGVTIEQVDNWLRTADLIGSYEVSLHNVYELIPLSDVIVATYSSVALEACTRGYPVICLQLPDFVNVSPLMDKEYPQVKFVANSVELTDALLEAGYNKYSSNIELYRELEEDFFFQLDGLSAERWTQTILDVITDLIQRKLDRTFING